MVSSAGGVLPFSLLCIFIHQDYFMHVLLHYKEFVCVG